MNKIKKIKNIPYIICPISPQTLFMDRFYVFYFLEGFTILFINLIYFFLFIYLCLFLEFLGKKILT